MKVSKLVKNTYYDCTNYRDDPPAHHILLYHGRKRMTAALLSEVRDRDKPHMLVGKLYYKFSYTDGGDDGVLLTRELVEGCVDGVWTGAR